MGQRLSLPGSAVVLEKEPPPASSTTTVRASSSLFDFALLLMGGRMLPSALPLPLGWDELLDWTEDATLTTALLRQSNLCQIENNKNDCDADAPDARTRQSGPNISHRFIPFTLKGESYMAEKLPEMSWLQRASFYSDNVVIGVETSTAEFIYLLSPLQFSIYYGLVCRLADLLALSSMHHPKKLSSSSVVVVGAGAQANNSSNDAALETPRDGIDISTCLICQNNSENAILPCGHALCEACEKRWVRARLTCPFCRHQYASAKEIASDGYHVAEWSESDLDNDIAALNARVTEFWKTVKRNQPLSTNRDALLATYVSAPRTIRFLPEQDGFVVIERGEYRRVHPLS